jgi:2-dehydro-3-deoxy-L-rhamnonate dehydrogenase (NAD+)
MIFEDRFKGRTAIVTGGASGLGTAIAARLVKEGAIVSLWDLRPDALTAAQREVGATHCASLDISDDRQVADSMTDTAQALGGKLDIMVTSAGVSGPNAPVAEYPVDAWKQIIDIDLNGVFYSNRAVVPHMQRNGYGRIVNIASISGKEGNPNAAAYSSAKAGVIAFTKALGKELARTEIRVNAVAPAAVRTPIFDQMTEEHVAFMLSHIPIGRFGTLDEIASIVTWLASEECSFSTGAVFDASGGRATY